MFELFEQGKRALDRTQGGLGVGLTLVQRLVQLHGGEVVASSAGAGQGSQFRVLLPCLGEDEAPAAAEAERAAARGGGARARILVVDDNVDVVETTTMLLSLSGHQVRSAKDGLQALHVASEFRPDVVLLDIGLPLMDGYEVARRLRQTPQTAGALLIALTGYGQQGDRQRGKDAGFDGHMLKPVDPHALARMIAGWTRGWPIAGCGRRRCLRPRSSSAAEAAAGVRLARARRRVAAARPSARSRGPGASAAWARAAACARRRRSWCRPA